MLVFWKEKLAVLAVPKTGTTAIVTALSARASLAVREPSGLKHTPAYRFHRFVQPYLATADSAATFETVAVLRHPVDWLGSWYRYRSRPALQGKPNSTQDISFDAFVAEYCKENPASFANVGSQARFIEGKDGGCGVTHLFRYEEQERLIAFLEARLGVDLVLPRVNVSPQRPITLSPEMEAELRARRPAEFAAWEAAGSTLPA